MALLAAALTMTAPLTALGQTATTGQQQNALYQYALAHMQSETQTLAGLTNHIPSREIVTVAVSGNRQTGRRDAARHAAIVAALSKPTVADVDRNNGQSPDSNSLAEYLQHLNVDPNKVVAVDVNTKLDPQNPHVTVFYRK